MELIRQSGRSGRLIHEMGMVFLAIMADRLDEAVERGLAGMRRLRERQRGAPASGVELLLLAAWLLRGDLQPARELGPPVWEAGRVFNQKGAVADTLTLLAAREGRPRAAMILAGYAGAEYVRGATKRLAVYRRCGEAAEAIAARSLSAPAMAAMRERGRRWPDAGIAALAFGSTDADVPPEADPQAASS
jgi:hypothetical protein